MTANIYVSWLCFALVKCHLRCFISRWTAFNLVYFALVWPGQKQMVFALLFNKYNKTTFRSGFFSFISIDIKCQFVPNKMHLSRSQMSSLLHEILFLFSTVLIFWVLSSLPIVSGSSPPITENKVCKIKSCEERHPQIYKWWNDKVGCKREGNGKCWWYYAQWKLYMCRMQHNLAG